MSKPEDLVEWRPEWSQADEAKVEAAVARLDERVSVMRTLREELGLSQAEVSELLDTTQSNVSKIEARSDPRLSVLRKLIEGKGGRLKLVVQFGPRSLELPI